MCVCVCDDDDDVGKERKAAFFFLEKEKGWKEQERRGGKGYVEGSPRGKVVRGSTFFFFSSFLSFFIAVFYSLARTGGGKN